MTRENKQDRINRIKEYCSVYENCESCPKFNKKAESCEVIEKLIGRQV